MRVGFVAAGAVWLASGGCARDQPRAPGVFPVRIDRDRAIVERRARPGAVIRHLVLVLACVLSGCGAPAGRVYAVPFGLARAELAGARVPLEVFGSNPDVDYQAFAAGPNRLVWRIHQRERALVDYVAELTPLDAGRTRVALTLIGATPAMAVRLANNASIAAFYRTAMEEQIAATLEHRPYNAERLLLPMMTAATANLGTIGDSMDRAATASRR